jgi:hypothetical protein
MQDQVHIDGVEHLKISALFASIILSSKGLLGTNTLAYSGDKGKKFSNFLSTDSYNIRPWFLCHPSGQQVVGPGAYTIKLFNCN